MLLRQRNWAWKTKYSPYSWGTQCLEAHTTWEQGGMTKLWKLSWSSLHMYRILLCMTAQTLQIIEKQMSYFPQTQPTVFSIALIGSDFMYTYLKVISATNVQENTFKLHNFFLFISDYFHSADNCYHPIYRWRTEAGNRSLPQSFNLNMGTVVQSVMNATYGSLLSLQIFLAPKDPFMHQNEKEAPKHLTFTYCNMY